VHLKAGREFWKPLGSLCAAISVLFGFLASGWCQEALPKEFAPGIVSTGHEFGLSFTADGQEAYFSRFEAKQPIHIFRTRLVKGVWQEPEKLPISGDTWSDPTESSFSLSRLALT
jgi:hypothetical protein